MNFAELRQNGNRNLRKICANPAASYAPPADTLPDFFCSRPQRGGIDVDNVHLKTPEGKVLVGGVSFSVMAGERLAVVGPNGAGKTSLLRLLFGQVAPTFGSVKIEGQPIHLMHPMDRARQIAVVSQSGQPDGRLKVRDYVELGRIPHRGRVTATVNKLAVEHAMDLVGLTRFADCRLGTLSGGERQRAGIARAVAQEPALLLLDEPTNHLDPRARADVMDLSCSLGCTVIAILHDLDRIASFANRVAVMSSGKLVACASVAEALAPNIVKSVFDMDCFHVVNPATGRNIVVFDTPAH